MSIAYVENIFSDQELMLLHDIINKANIPVVDNGEYISVHKNKGTGINEFLGRIQIGNIVQECSNDIKNKLTIIANNLSDTTLFMTNAVYCEYNKKYGNPNLPPHFDGDTNELIINFQLLSNTYWDLGLGLKVYSIKNNSALIFNGNTNIHWRPRKTFNDGDYVKMIFFRFAKKDNNSDYSHLPMNQIDSAFKEVVQFRDSL